MSDFPQSATSGLPGQHPTSTYGVDNVDANTARHTSATGNSEQVGTEAEPAFGASVSPTTSRGAYTTDSEKAKEIAARATGGAVGYGQDAGSRADYGLDADTGVRDGRVRDTTGVGAVGVGSSAVTGSSIGGYQAGNDRLNSTTGDTLGSDRFGSSSGLPAGNDRFNSTTGDSIGSDRFGSTGGLSAGNNPEGARDPMQAGLEGTTDRTEDRKTSRAVEGASTGANPDESQTSAEQSHNQPKSGGSKGKLENKDAIPIAGGIKLGEKHWGESDIIPDNPRPSGDNVSSAAGQPDQSTRDNTAANAGDTHGAGSPEKEGILDKVKDKLNIGHKD